MSGPVLIVDGRGTYPNNLDTTIEEQRAYYRPNHQIQREEYQLRAVSGRIVMAFDRRDRAIQEGKKRQLKIFHVTHIEEEILP